MALSDVLDLESSNKKGKYMNGAGAVSGGEEGGAEIAVDSGIREASIMSLESVWRVEQRISPFLDLVMFGAPRANHQHRHRHHRTIEAMEAMKVDDIPSIEEIVDALIAGKHIDF
jgi:hypothetical protein